MKTPEYRCSNCGRLLFVGQAISAHIEIKCHSCKHMNYIGDNYNNFTRNQYAFIVEIHEKAPGVYVERIISCTPSVSKALDYTQSEVILYNLETIDLLYAHSANNLFWSRYDSNQNPSCAMDTIHKRKDGGLLKVHTTIQTLRKQDGVRTALYMCEVIETKGILLNSDLTFTSPTSMNNPRMVLQISKKGICIYVSNGIERALGYMPRSLLLTSLFEHFGGDDPKKLQRFILDKGHTQTSFHVTKFPLMAQDGTTKTYSAYFITHYQDNGVYDGYSILLS